MTGYEKSHLLAWQTAPGEWVWQLEAQGSDSTAVTLPYDWRREGFTYDRPKGQGNCVMVREVAPSTRD